MVRGFEERAKVTTGEGEGEAYEKNKTKKQGVKLLKEIEKLFLSKIIFYNVKRLRDKLFRRFLRRSSIW
jgi:hypothetical protein